MTATQRSIGIVVLAAGAASRFGSAKQLLQIDGAALVQRAACAARASAAHVVVVTGAHRAAVEACLAGLPIECVFNADWESGMGSSIGCGIRALAAMPAVDAAIIALADQAEIGSTAFADLAAKSAGAPMSIVAAGYAGIVGPPCLFPRRYFGELCALRGDHGARSVLERYASDVRVLTLPAAAIDIDTQADYARLTRSRRADSAS
jgi:molybdenum cofactor cytidylyltransferase